MTKIVRFYFLVGLTFVHFFTAQANREHKVHNIVLYPDKHSWCKTTTIKQVISYPGCVPIEIDNNVCVGACFSYSIPHTEPSNPGEAIVPYCDSCQPSKTQWLQITLHCNKTTEAEIPSQLIKHVQIIKNCSCTSCEKDSLSQIKFTGNSDNTLLQQNVNTEFFKALQNRNESTFTAARSDDLLANHKLANLFEDIQVNSTRQEKQRLIEMLNVTQVSLLHRTTIDNIVDLIDILRNNKTNLNVPHLANMLLKFENLKHHSSEYDDEINQESPYVQNEYGVGEKVSQEDDATPLPLASSSAQSDKQSSELPEIRQQHLSIHKNDIEKNSMKDCSHSSPGSDEHATSNQDQHQQELHRHQPHQHRVNENIISNGHLARGPHGALVIELDRVQEKFDVNVNELKPNHAGTLLSYHSHSVEHNLLV